MYNMSQIFKIQLEMTTIKVINTLESVKKTKTKTKEDEENLFFF